MKISSGVLAISIISFIEGPAEGANATFDAVMDQFHSILKHNTDTVDILLELSTGALAPIPIGHLVELTRSVNKSLFKYMHDLYEITTEANIEPAPYLSAGAVIEVARMCNHSAVLKEALKNINITVSNLRQGNFEKPFQLMPMGPPRTFLIVNPSPPKKEHQLNPKSNNSNLEEVLTNVEDAITAKRWIFEFIKGFLVDLPDPRLAHSDIPSENVNKMHDALFKLLEFLKYVARNTPDLVVDDFLVAESKKLRKLALSIYDGMLALDINMYGYGYGYTPLNYQLA